MIKRQKYFVQKRLIMKHYSNELRSVTPSQRSSPNYPNDATKTTILGFKSADKAIETRASFQTKTPSNIRYSTTLGKYKNESTKMPNKSIKVQNATLPALTVVTRGTHLMLATPGMATPLYPRPLLTKWSVFEWQGRLSVNVVVSVQSMNNSNKYAWPVR